MSHTKPKLSEIRARAQSAPGGARFDVPHLLDLVKRLGRMIENLNLRHHSDHYGLFEDCDYPKCRRVRALLEELEQ